MLVLSNHTMQGKGKHTQKRKKERVWGHPRQEKVICSRVHGSRAQTLTECYTGLQATMKAMTSQIAGRRWWTGGPLCSASLPQSVLQLFHAGQRPIDKVCSLFLSGSQRALNGYSRCCLGSRSTGKQANTCLAWFSRRRANASRCAFRFLGRAAAPPLVLSFCKLCKAPISLLASRYRVSYLTNHQVKLQCRKQQQQRGHQDEPYTLRHDYYCPNGA